MPSRVHAWAALLVWVGLCCRAGQEPGAQVPFGLCSFTSLRRALAHVTLTHLQSPGRGYMGGRSSS